MEVKVYSTSMCPWCNRVKDFLKQNKIEFEDINVEENREKAQEMIESSGQMGVPVIDINGEIVIGFDKERLKQLLKIKENV